MTEERRDEDDLDVRDPAPGQAIEHVDVRVTAADEEEASHDEEVRVRRFK
jgi:hypothetical protein